MSEGSPVEVNVQVLQRRYRLRCLPEDVESLQRSARTLDRYMREMQESVSADVFSNEKLAIAVAINLIGTITKQEDQLQDVEIRANRLKNRILECSQEISQG